jgi:hypothetical protein
MTYDDDGLDRLLRRMPAPGVPAEARERHLAQLREAMATESAPAVPSGGRILRRWRSAHAPMSHRRRVVIAIVAASAVVVAGTAAATLAWQRAQDRTKVHCYPIITTDFDNPRLGGDATQIDADSAAMAVDLCRSAWEGGYLTSTPPYIDNGTPVPAPAPPLIACVLPSDVVGVFPAPNGQTCESLGLPTSEG